MSLVRHPLYVDGVWGPYAGAVFPDTFLHEAGQSATGRLIDFVIESHPAYAQLQQLAGTVHVQMFLNETLQKITLDGRVEELTRDVHVWPDYHGNRSPLADSQMRGMVSVFTNKLFLIPGSLINNMLFTQVCGLSMSNDLNNLAIIYLATIQALAVSYSS